MVFTVSRWVVYRHREIGGGDYVYVSIEGVEIEGLQYTSTQISCFFV